MNLIQPRLLKGFRDYGLHEQAARQVMFGVIQSTFERFGFMPLATPVLEYKEILLGKYGEDEKLVYSFKDNGDREVAMRYDLTVPLARYVAQNQNTLIFPFKRYQIAPVWRADNPQKGRFREFFQCDVDIVGVDAVMADAEILICLCKSLEALGISNYRLRLNDRRLFAILSEAVTEAAVTDHVSALTEVMRSIDKVDKIGKDAVISILSEKGMSTELCERVDRWLSAGVGLSALENIGSLTSEDQMPLFNEIRTRTLQLIGLVKAGGISEDKIIFDPSIARGLDYYTSTVFEVVLPQKPEYGSVCSGGRYDTLVDQFSEKPLAAVGGSIGVDRLLDAMSEMNAIPEAQSAHVLVMNIEQDLESTYMDIAARLRKDGISVELYYTQAKIDRQFKYAESKGIKYAVIIGKNEVQKNTAQLKNLQTREQEEVSTDTLSQHLTK